MKLRAFIDGSCQGNPGEAGCGIVLQDQKGNILQTKGKYLGQGTNNTAEYEGLLGCLELAAPFNPEELEVFSDSLLLVNQINGVYRIKQPHLQRLRDRIQAQAKELSFDFTIQHIPREQNKLADKLARRAIIKRGNIDSIE